MTPLRQPWRVLVLVLALGHVGVAEAGERVVLCGPGTSACADAPALGKLAGGTWARIEDAPLLSARPMPTVLYFSLRQYDEAMAGLDEAGQTAALRRRREVVTSNLAGQVRSELVQSLSRSAQGLDEKELAVLIEAAGILDGGEARLRGSQPRELLDACSDDLAQLRSELPQGRLAEIYAGEADALARLSAQVRGSTTPLALPFAEPVAAYFVPKMSPQAMRILQDTGSYPHPWRGGVVALAGTHALARPPFRGQSPKALYPSQADYLADLTQLTPAQLGVQLTRRWQHGYDREAFVARRTFQHAVVLSAVTARLQTAGVPWLEDFQRIVATSRQGVRQAAAGVKDGRAQTGLVDVRADLALAEAILRGGAAPAKHIDQVVRAGATLSRLPP